MWTTTSVHLATATTTAFWYPGLQRLFLSYLIPDSSRLRSFIKPWARFISSFVFWERTSVARVAFWGSRFYNFPLFLTSSKLIMWSEAPEKTYLWVLFLRLWCSVPLLGETKFFVFKRTLNLSRIRNLPLFYFNLHRILTCRWYFCGGCVW